MISKLRRIGAHPRLEPTVATALRARLVSQSARFFVREILGDRADRRIRRYSLRGSGIRVALGHGTPDVDTLDEFWYTRVYEPPTHLAERLARLPTGAVVVDLGANVGMFVAWLLQRVTSPVIQAFEPDPRNVAVLTEMLRANDSRISRWSVDTRAAGAHDGRVRFAAGQFTTSHIVADEHAPGMDVPIVDVLPLLASCDVLKIDIEGGEWPILRDGRFGDCTAKIVVLECHPGGDGGTDPIARAQELLARAGYRSDATYVSGVGSATVWGWREAESEGQAG